VVGVAVVAVVVAPRRAAVAALVLEVEHKQAVVVPGRMRR
jgi:hypothetical protein